MERATRERLTGAVILVAVLAILVPEMLSGPGESQRAAGEAEAMADTGPPLTTYEVPLNRSGGAVVRQADPASVAQAVPPPVIAPSGSDAGVAELPQADAANASTAQARNEPATTSAQRAPASETARSSAPTDASRPAATSSTPKPATAATAPKPATTTPARPAAATGQWWVQLGSFASEQNAQNLARKLRANGHTIEVAKVRSGDRDLYRVRAGPVKDRAAATTLRDRLAAGGDKGTLVAP